MAFHGFDFIVDAFEFAVGYREVIPSEDAIVVFQKSVGDRHQGFDARVPGLFNPVIQHQSRVVLVVLPPYTAQRFLEVVCGGQRAVDVNNPPSAMAAERDEARQEEPTKKA